MEGIKVETQGQIICLYQTALACGSHSNPVNHIIYSLFEEIKKFYLRKLKKKIKQTKKTFLVRLPDPRLITSQMLSNLQAKVVYGIKKQQ